MSTIIVSLSDIIINTKNKIDPIANTRLDFEDAYETALKLFTVGG